MRKSVKDLVCQTITLEYNLPHDGYKIPNSKLTNFKDSCFERDEDITLSKIIYNNIIEFSLSEDEIDYNNLSTEQMRVLGSYLRYNEDASEQTKIKYGFYGEVLLYSILYCKFGSDVLISKGYFYSPLERGEAKGYDVFHIIDNNGSLEFWFGEAKFYKDINKPIKDILNGIEFSLSDEYLNRNLIAIFKQKHYITNGSDLIESLINKWKKNPYINLAEELNKNDMTLVYPIFISYEKKASLNYHENIKRCINFINKTYEELDIEVKSSMKLKIFFILLPVENVKEIKRQVVEWISKKEPLI